jgi:hypothetical protein
MKRVYGSPSIEAAFTAQDEAFLAAEARGFEVANGLIETAHLDSRLARFQKEGEAIKAKLMELHKDEAANCMEMALAAAEDSKAAL